MGQRDKFQSALVKAKANWRRVCDSSDSTAGDRLRARVDWRKAQVARDRALLVWRQALAERRRTAADRRKANPNIAWTKEHSDRRKLTRRP